MRLFFLKLFFTLVFLEITSVAIAQHWPYLAVEDKISNVAVSYTSILTADITLNGQSYLSIPHLAYTENKKARVKRYVDGLCESFLKAT